MSASDAQTESAYAAWAAAYPVPAKKNVYLGARCDKDMIRNRFQGLAKIVGSDAALDMVQKEPFLMFRDATVLQASWDALKDMEEDTQRGLVMEAVQKNPKLLTIPDFEYRRTKPSLDSLAFAASAIDALRPFGQAGLTVVIFGSFVVFISILRPFLYGFGGGPSLLQPIINMLPSIPRPYELLEGTGINLASVVLVIPLYIVYQSFKARFFNK